MCALRVCNVPWLSKPYCSLCYIQYSIDVPELAYEPSLNKGVRPLPFHFIFMTIIIMFKKPVDAEHSLVLGKVGHNVDCVLGLWCTCVLGGIFTFSSIEKP